VESGVKHHKQNKQTSYIITNNDCFNSFLNMLLKKSINIKPIH
jgi:hypothetical protein